MIGRPWAVVARTAIGAHVVDVQRLWKSIYNWPALAVDGSQWDRLFVHCERFAVGSIAARVMFSPGHTLASNVEWCWEGCDRPPPRPG